MKRKQNSQQTVQILMRSKINGENLKKNENKKMSRLIYQTISKGWTLLDEKKIDFR